MGVIEGKNTMKITHNDLWKNFLYAISPMTISQAVADKIIAEWLIT